MDLQVVDQAYQQVRAQDQGIAQELQALAGKLQAAAQAGNLDAREWLLDLRQLALAVQGQQQQMNLLLQAIHAAWQNQAAAQQMSPQMAPQMAPPMQQPGYAPAQGYAPAPMGFAQPAAGGGIMGALGGLFNSSFGQAIEMGAGIGLGEDLINKLF